MAFRVKDANKSSLNTKAKIKDAFFKLLYERKSASKITVKELCLEAGIQRSTFYIHYRDIYDIEDSIIDLFYKNIVAIVPPIVSGPKDVEKFYVDLFDYVGTRKSDIEIILRDREATQILETAKSKLIKAFGVALKKGNQKVNDALALILLNGVFSVIYEILTEAVSVSLESIRDEAMTLSKYLFIK